MKLNLTLMLGAIALLWGCTNETPTDDTSDTDQTTSYQYVVSVNQLSKPNAPALQSFIHGVSGSKWLLFGGRTNAQKDDGGLHDLNGNYASSSFVPVSFNEHIMVYDFGADTTYTMSISKLAQTIQSTGDLSENQEIAQKGRDIANALNSSIRLFRNSNPLVVQEGNYLYVVGGYGFDISGKDTTYSTTDLVAKINVSGMIDFITGIVNYGNFDDLIRIGNAEDLGVTGGEMHMIGGTLYACGGHNFGSTAPQQAPFFGQKYRDAVYPFTVSNGSGTTDLVVNVQSPITDMVLDNLLDSYYADQHSKFRRRDGPIVPLLLTNPVTFNIDEGVAFYSGVFLPDSTGRSSQPWANALYIHPSYTADYTIKFDTLGVLDTTFAANFTLDASYNQAAWNVYSCADFSVYDASTGEQHTFLPGGIGDGTTQAGFTNGYVVATMDVGTGKSSNVHVDGLFGAEKAPFYGAEAAFIPATSSITYYSTTQGQTEIIDATSFQANNQLVVGYIYGGIVSQESNPGTFGPGNSAASNAIWEVTVTRVAQ